MIRLVRIAERLAVGSRAYARRLGTRAAAWCARGRRDDLSGWRGALGIFVRITLLALGVYVLARLVRSLPALMWLLTGWWTVASWRAGKVAPEAPVKAPAEPDAEAVRALLLKVMEDRPGVHLRTVLGYLKEHGHWEGKTVSDLRVHLERLDIPVDRGVKAAGVPTWGVRRRDLEAPSPTVAEETSTAPSTAA